MLKPGAASFEGLQGGAGPVQKIVLRNMVSMLQAIMAPMM